MKLALVLALAATLAAPAFAAPIKPIANYTPAKAHVHNACFSGSGRCCTTTCNTDHTQCETYCS